MKCQHSLAGRALSRAAGILGAAFTIGDIAENANSVLQVHHRTELNKDGGGSAKVT